MNCRIARRGVRCWVGFLVVAILTGAATVEAQPSRKNPQTVHCLAFSPDGRRLAACASDGLTRGELVVWDVATWKPVFRHREPVGFPRLAYSPDGKVLALSRFAPETKLFDAESGKLLRELKGHTNHARCVTFTPDGKKIITGSYDRTVRIWDAKTGQLEHTLEGHKSPVYAVAVSPNGALLAAAEANANSVRLWDLKTRKTVHVFEKLGSLVPCVCFSPDGTLLGAASWAGHFTLFDTATHQKWLRLRPAGGVNYGQFSPDGRWLAVVTNGWTVYVFRADRTADKKTKQKVRKLLSRFEDDSYDVREKASRALAAIGPAAEPQLHAAMKSRSAEVRWRARKLRQRLANAGAAIQLKGHDDELECVSFSPDGKLLASGDHSGRIKIWKVGKWTELKTLSIADSRDR